MSSSFPRFLPLVLASPLLGLVGCDRPWQDDDGKLPFTMTDPATDYGEAIQRLHALVTYVDAVVLVIVAIVLLYTLFRFRDDGSGRKPEQIHGNTQLELGWTMAPVVIVVALLVPTVRTIFELGNAAPDGSLEVRVVGKRWWWAFDYLKDGVVTANDLHIPAGVPVSLILESDSVIHSFWAPRIGGKRDVIPGRQNRMWFTVTDPVAAGTPVVYRGECAEFCGESHAYMRFDVIAHEAGDFAKWVQDMKTPVETPSDAQILQGKDRFVGAGCAGCHAITGHEQAKGIIGPNLTRFGTRQWLGARTEPNTPENLVKWIMDPNSMKPGTSYEGNISRGVEGANDGMNVPGDDPNIPGTQVSQADAEAIAAYLLSLK